VSAKRDDIQFHLAWEGDDVRLRARFVLAIADICAGFWQHGAMAGGAIVKFGVSGARWTYPGAINSAGTIAGTYQVDGHKYTYGAFVRGSDGSVVAFQPGGTRDDGMMNVFINDTGEVAGSYEHHSKTYGEFGVGWIRDTGGAITKFRVRGHGGSTYVASVNGTGYIAGSWGDSDSSPEHGYLRAPDGKFQSFDAPNEAYGTGVTGLNDENVITGSYADTNYTSHGYVRAADGTFAEFDAPDAGSGEEEGTYPAAIDSAGKIAGSYVDTAKVDHGFIRTAAGAIAEFDAPGACGNCGTRVLAINNRGAVAGVYADANNMTHGFVRAGDGTFTEIDVPAKYPRGTWAAAINDHGQVTGSFSFGRSRDGQSEGFVMKVHKSQER
jgi:hypothetical protein